MARAKGWLLALGLLALLFAPGALAAAQHDDLGAAALAPTFSSDELTRAPSPLPALPPPAPLLALAAGLVVFLVVVAPVDLPRPLPATTVRRRGPPRRRP